MVQFSSLLNGLAKNVSIKHGRKRSDGGREIVDALAKEAKKKNKGSLGLILATAIPGVTFILIICLVFIIWRRKRWNDIFTCFLPRNTSLDIEDGNSYFGVPVFSYKDLEEATHNFDASRELGDGGYGAVYHGPSW